MDGPTLAAFILDGLTLPATGVAVWQAIHAKREAAESKTAADSAERMAIAMEEQVNVFKQRFAAEERDRTAPDKPVFQVNSGEIAEDATGERRVGLRITQNGGVALSSVKVSVSGAYILGIRLEDDEPAAKPERDLGPSADGKVHSMWIGVEYRHVPPLSIALRIDATARDSEQTWVTDTTLHAKWRPAPPPGADTTPRRGIIREEWRRPPFVP